MDKTANPVDGGVVAAIILLIAVGVAVSLTSFIIFTLHKGGAFGLAPAFMGATVAVWGSVKLLRALNSRDAGGVV